ncbi:MAG: glycosyltransferase [Lachnospiraceae bacterium]|nr:glycosyltransferase [Lachnospiraceae bacterium]
MKSIVVIMPSMIGGGSERVLSVLMNSLIKKKYQVVLALIKKDAVIEYNLDKKIIVEKNEKIGKNKIHNIWLEITYIRHIMNKYATATCISFISMYNLYTIIASIGRRVNVIVSERCDPKRSFKKYKNTMDKLRQILYKKANYVVFQTKEASEYFEGLKNTRIIPNPLANDLPEKYNYDDEKIFVAIGRLEEQKNYKMLIQAMNIVCDKFPEVKLKIYGKGIKEEELRAYTNSLKYSEQIIFEGFTDEIHSELLSAYAYISSSDYEGISNAMLEALAIGVPCICTDCPVGGAREFIEDHVNGILVKVGDTQGMANAIIELLEYPNNRECYGNKGKLIRKKINVDKIVSIWETLFE